MPVPEDGPGLRERKKAQVRRSIQGRALALFREQGYEATTVDQIIGELDVSQRTFFRYFPTKESLVLDDDFDLVLVDELRGQPADLSLVDAMRGSLRSLFAHMSSEQQDGQRERLALVLAVPDLRATLVVQLTQTMRVLGGAIAERTGRAADDFAVRTVSGAVVGVTMAVLEEVAERPDADTAVLMDEALVLLSAGLEIGPSGEGPRS